MPLVENVMSNFSSPITADAIRDLTDLKKNLDDIFLLTNAIVVSLMQAGFACLEAGAVRSKNSTNIMMKNLFDLFIAAIAYYLIGFTLAYGHGSSFMGMTWWAGIGFPESKLAFWFFQFIFAATAATILSGAVAERCNFAAYIIYNAVISGWVYPVVSHWAWHDEGWLNVMGFEDYAGSGVVHALAGVASFVAAAFLGPRKGRFPGSPIPGHSIPLLGLGTLLLISGFLAFNGGSLGHMSNAGDGEIISRSMVSTIMGGCGAAVVSLIVGKYLGDGPWPFTWSVNGILSGMVSICAAADNYTSGAAMIVGAIGACAFIGLHYLVILAKVDDPLDACAVHFGAGFWGVIAKPIFSNSGLLYGNTEAASTLLINILGLAAIIAWTTANSAILFGALKYLGIFRVSEEQELAGMDISMHGEVAYPPSSWEWQTSSRWQEEGAVGKSGDCKLEKVDYDNFAFQGDKKHEHER